MDHDLTGSEDNTPKCYIVYIYIPLKEVRGNPR